MSNHPQDLATLSQIHIIYKHFSFPKATLPRFKVPSFVSNLHDWGSLMSIRLPSLATIHRTAAKVIFIKSKWHYIITPLEFLQWLSITQNKVQSSSQILQDLSWFHPCSPPLLPFSPCILSSYLCSSAKGLSFFSDTSSPVLPWLFLLAFPRLKHSCPQCFRKLAPSHQ